jgi:hypothetical protein
MSVYADRLPPEVVRGRRHDQIIVVKKMNPAHFISLPNRGAVLHCPCYLEQNENAVIFSHELHQCAVISSLTSTVSGTSSFLRVISPLLNASSSTDHVDTAEINIVFDLHFLQR